MRWELAISKKWLMDGIYQFWLVTAPKASSANRRQKCRYPKLSNGWMEEQWRLLGEVDWVMMMEECGGDLDGWSWGKSSGVA